MYQAHYLTSEGIKKYKDYLLEVNPEKKIKHLHKSNLIENIIDTIYRYFDVPIETRLNKDKTRKMQVIRAKQFSMFYVRREFPNVTLENIGKYYDVDHATVIHGVRKIQDLTEVDREYQLYKSDLDKKIKELYK